MTVLSHRDAWHSALPEVEMQRAGAHERLLLERLKAALTEHHFRLFVQPIAPLGLDGPGVTHVEVLLRLGGDGALLAPGTFMRTAERHGLMPEIDRWVIRAALAWWAENRSRLANPGCLALNLSAQSLGELGFAADLVAELEASGVAPETLIFELTETQAIVDLARARRVVGQLRRLGCYAALDDFGSGHCSFRYLRELPIDYLKAAGTFVQAIDEDPIDLALVAAMNELGHDLGIKTVAEYVETPAILERVQALGMDYAQGYGIGKPHPIEDLLAPQVSTAAA